MSGAGALLVIGVAALALALGVLVVVLRRIPARLPATSNAALLADQAQADAEQIRARAVAEADNILGRATEAAEQAARQAAQIATEQASLRPAAGLLQHLDQLGDGGMAAAGERAADPVEHAAAGLVHGVRREIAETRACKVAAQRLGQGDGVGVEVLIHRWVPERSLARPGTETSHA